MKNKNHITISDELIVKYLAGNAAPEEAEALHDWLSIPENEIYFKEFQNTWDTTLPAEKPSMMTTEAAWEIFSRDAVKQNPPSSGFSRTFLFKIAASILVVLACGIAGYLFFSDQPSDVLVVVTTNERAKTVHLPDSSVVVLHRRTSISYPENFGKQIREVTFSGEGYFRVQGNPDIPFVIRTSAADVRVVGTVFNVFAGNDRLDVSVEEGKVVLVSKTDSTLLHTGQAGSTRLGNPGIDVSDFIDINNWGYATNKFSFNDASLTEVIRQLEKAFPYRIEIQNKDIKNCKLTATFDQVSAREILNLIGETLDLTVQENDSTFRIEGKGCPWDQ